jgi:hypothetical protein
VETDGHGQNLTDDRDALTLDSRRAGWGTTALADRTQLANVPANLRESAMSYDRSTVEKVIQHYFDGLYDNDADKIGAIFHPTADLRWQDNGELKVLPVADWVAMVRKRAEKKSPPKAREDFIVTIDRSDAATAFVKVRCQLPPRYFTDYLIAMKLKDGWQIVSKSYRADVRE